MTIIDQTPADTKSDTEAVVPTGVRRPVVGHDDVMYRLMPFHVSMAAVHAQRDGHVQPEEFPASVGDWIADGINMRAFLEERGLWANYRKHLADTAIVTDCPGWCGTRHEDARTDGMSIVHELPLPPVTLSEGETVTFAIEGYQDERTTEQVKPFLFINTSGHELGDLELTAQNATDLAAAFARAGKVLADIEALLAGATPAEQSEAQS